MIVIDIPGFGLLKLKTAVFDYNGTLAVDGVLLPGVAIRFQRLSALLDIHVLTADTFGQARQQLKDLTCKVKTLKTGNEDAQKRKYIEKLGQEKVIAFGNGNNDRSMLELARVGVVVLQNEGISASIFHGADVVVTSVFDGLDLLFHPLRLKSTLRF